MVAQNLGEGGAGKLGHLQSFM